MRLVRPVVVLLLLSSVALSQPTADDFTHLGLEAGLSQSSVTAILQDRDGFMWFGTNDGLNRYDGVSFEVYRRIVGDEFSLLSNRVLDVLEDKSGILWVATQGGLQWFDRRSGEFRTPRDGPGTGGTACGTIVSVIAETPDNALWSGSLTGQICRRGDGERAFKPILRDDVPASSSVQNLVVAPDGSVWVSGSPTSCVVRHGGSVCEALQDDVLPIYADEQNDLIGVADAGSALSSQFVRKAGGTWSLLASFERTRMSMSPQAVERVGGELWIATESDGVLILDPRSGVSTRIESRPTVGSGFRDPTVQAIYRDPSGSVWLGTTGGIGRWEGRRSRFELFRAGPGGLSNSRVNGVYVSRDGNAWVATNDGLNFLDVDTREAEVYRRATSGQSVHPNAFWRVLEDRDGQLVVSSRREGIFVLDRETGEFQRDPFYDALAGSLAKRAHVAAVRYIGFDRRGRTWVGAPEGVTGYDPETGQIATYRSRTDRLPSHRVNVVYEDRRDDIWVGTDAGVCRLDLEDDVFECVTVTDGLGAEVIWTLAESSVTPDVLWVGTIGGGLCSVDLEGFSTECISLANGLPSDVIYGIIPDDDGAMWLTTTSGLVRFDPLTRAVQRYTEADGLQSNEFDLMAFDRGPGGWIVVGGKQGLNRFHPARLSRTSPPPLIRFTGVAVLGRKRPGLPASGDTLRLRHDEAVFSIDFAALAYTAPSDNRYRYRLIGHDSGWRDTDGRRPTATYSRVSPGTYAFEVIGSNHEGVFSKGPARLRIEIRPAWWQRGDVRLLTLAALVFGVASVVVTGIRRREGRAKAARDKHVHLQRRLAESRERERYRIARDLHDGPVQGLYRLGHQLDRASMRGDGKDVLAAREQVNAVADELRHVLQALRPPIIEQLGVGPALSSLARAFRRAHPETTVADRVEIDGRGWPFEVQHALYRVAQEALSNAERHASPTVVTVQMTEDESGVRLVVEDDGVGFVKPLSLVDLAQEDHFGLVGLVERVEAHRGRITIESEVGDGTRISAWIPAISLEGDGRSIDLEDVPESF